MRIKLAAAALCPTLCIAVLAGSHMLPRTAGTADGAVTSDAAGAVALRGGPRMPAGERDDRVAPARDLRVDRSRAEVRQRLREGQAGTYIDEILLSRDSALARWRDRSKAPLRVWVQPASRIEGWRPEFAELVYDAFDDWSGVGIPVPFRFVRDSAAADVHVTWIDRFSQPISGKTRWARDGAWWIVEANIVLAVHHHTGEMLDAEAVKAIALHEVGHLLGLDHSADARNIMTPKVRVRTLSSADRATLRLLYSLPAGAVR